MNLPLITLFTTTLINRRQLLIKNTLPKCSVTTGCAKKTPWRNCDIMTTVRYFSTIFVRLIEEIFSHVSIKCYSKILETSNFMNFLRKISKFQSNHAYKTEIFFIPNFYFLFELTKLTKREYASEISSLHTEAD